MSESNGTLKLAPIRAFRPSEIRAVVQEAGRPLSSFDEGDQVAFMVWLNARRTGEPISFADAQEVMVEIEVEPNPQTPGSTPAASLPSAATGG